MHIVPHTNLRKILALALTAFMAVSSTFTAWGWFTHNLTAISWIPGLATMKFNEALLFLLCATGVLAIWRGHESVTIGCGLAVLTVATLTALQDLLGINLHIDQLFVRDRWSEDLPGRMSLGTSISFCLGGALLAVHNRYPQQKINLYDLMISGFLAIPLFTFFSYIFAPGELLQTPIIGTMALHTTFNFLCFFFAISLFTNGKGAAGLLNRNTRNGRHFRVLFFMVLILPLSLGSVLNFGVQERWIGPGIGIAIFCLFTTMLVASALAHHTIVQDHWFKQLLRERRRAAQMHMHIRELLEISADGILLFDRDLGILYANSGAQRILGYSPEELTQMNFAQLLVDDQGDTLAAVGHYIRNPEGPLHLEATEHLTLRKKNGSPAPVALSFGKKNQDQETRAVAIIKNISQLDNKIRSLEKKARTDALTKLDNRAEFEAYCHKLRDKVTRKSDQSFCMMLLDLDNFKRVNDDYGHVVGDEVLRVFAAVVANNLREGDRFFRLGGEEFVIVANNLQREDAWQLAERIRDNVAKQAFTFAGHHLRITCSIGIYLSGSQGFDPDTALTAADEAMYRAKRSGKNRCELVTDDSD